MKSHLAKGDQFQNIEVAVRLRPLNSDENEQDQESAWDIKKREGHLQHLS